MEIVNDNNCSWINNLSPRTNVRDLQSYETCDWLVVGAGYTGLSASRKLAQLHPNKKSVGTGSGFEGRADGKKIDYVFVQPEAKIVTASIIRTNRSGRYPSDHSPVMAEIQLSTIQQNTR